jgi:hypothetical protein
VEAPDIGKSLAKAMGLDLARLSSRLFADISVAFEAGKVTVDKSDAENPVISVNWQGKQATLQTNQNLQNLTTVSFSSKESSFTCPSRIAPTHRSKPSSESSTRTSHCSRCPNPDQLPILAVTTAARPQYAVIEVRGLP